MGEYITDVLDNGIGKFLVFAHHKDPRGEKEADKKLVNLSHLFHLSTQRERTMTKKQLLYFESPPPWQIILAYYFLTYHLERCMA